MFVTRIPTGYQFSSQAQHSSLRIELTCWDDGSEQISVCSDHPPLRLPPARVPSGTIESCIGVDRWRAFLRLRARGFESMFVDPPGVVDGKPHLGA